MQQVVTRVGGRSEHGVEEEDSTQSAAGLVLSVHAHASIKTEPTLDEATRKKARRGGGLRVNKSLETYRVPIENPVWNHHSPHQRIEKSIAGYVKLLSLHLLEESQISQG
jgi:hypothetical protein